MPAHSSSLSHPTVPRVCSTNPTALVHSPVGRIVRSGSIIAVNSVDSLKAVVTACDGLDNGSLPLFVMDAGILLQRFNSLCTRSHIEHCMQMLTTVRTKNHHGHTSDLLLGCLPVTCLVAARSFTPAQELEYILEVLKAVDGVSGCNHFGKEGGVWRSSTHTDVARSRSQIQAHGM